MSALDTAKTLIEGFEGCKLTSYQDQRGIWTIGYGSTGPGIQAGLEWTQQQADERFAQDLEKFLNGVRNLMKLPPSDNQLAAATSFAYNIGLGNFERSGFLRFYNQGKNDTAADQMLLWNRVGMYVSPGLEARRQKERALFVS